MALIDKIKAIADAIRNKTGDTAPMTLDEMAESIEYLEGDGSPMQTFILVDEDGYEMQAFLTEEEVELNATPNDIRIGMTAVTDTGVTVGEKEIPSYNTMEGVRVITPGSRIEIANFKNCEYTKLQVLICAYSSSLNNSVATEKVSINGNVYNVASSDIIAAVTVDPDSRSIDLGINNEGTTPCIMRFFTYKEIY